MLRLALAGATVATIALVAAVAVAVATGSGGGSQPAAAGVHGSHPHGQGYDPPPPAGPPPPPAPAGPRSLVATVGPAATISLRKANGARLGRLPRGRYTITVDDRSAEHNFHLYGPGVNKRTGVAFVGQRRWTVQLRKGKLYRFRCDPHLFSMRGSFRTR